MPTSPKKLFTSLSAGDLLIVPFKPDPSADEATMFQVTVLRVGDQGEVFLSFPSTELPISAPDVRCNPFIWSHKDNVLVDCDGDVPPWYSEEITHERGGAQDAAAEYAAVPREEQLRHHLNQGDVDGFKNGPLFPAIAGIIRNGEVNYSPDQLSLALDLLGVEHTKQQLVGLSWLLFLSGQQTAPHVITINIKSEIGDED